MASFWYTSAKLKLAQGNLDFDTADLRAKLLMSNTTAASNEDATNIAGITTLDEYDGSGYSEADLTVAAPAADNTNNRAEIDVTDFTFGATVAAGTRNAVAMLLYVYVDGTTANDYPVAYIDTGGFPFAGNGGAINVTVNTEGLLQIT